MDIKKIWSFPLVNSGVYIKDSASHNVFNWVVQLTEEYKNNLVSVINGESISDSFFESIHSVSYSVENGGIYIIINEFKVLLVRSYGYLTGTSGLNMSGEEAVQIQMTLAKYVCQQINDGISKVK